MSIPACLQPCNKHLRTMCKYGYQVEPLPVSFVASDLQPPKHHPFEPIYMGNQQNFYFLYEYGEPTELTQTPKANTQNNKLKRNVKIVKTPLIPKA